jgi:hypothetical protein
MMAAVLQALTEAHQVITTQNQIITGLCVAVRSPLAGTATMGEFDAAVHLVDDVMCRYEITVPA